jgi:hypothetical protein
VDENHNALAPRPRRRFRLIRRILLGLIALILIFHRPIVFGVGRAVANRYAARENLKVDYSLGGSIFTNLIIQNLHVVPTGPALIEAADADYLRIDYSLWDLWRQGLTEVLKNAEIRSARVVLNPGAPPPKLEVKISKDRITLFPLFPDRLKLSNVNFHLRSTDGTKDLIVDHLNLELDPAKPGELHMDALQIPGAPIWRNISARTSYTNKNLVIADLVLDDENQFRLIAIDASRLKSKSLEMVLDATLAGGTVAGSVALSEATHSLETKTRLVAERVSLDRLRGYFGAPPGFPGGEVERVGIESSGAIDSPRTWDAKIEVQLNNLQWPGFALDRCLVNAEAHNGVATVQSAVASKGSDTIEVTGTAELPGEVRLLGQSPANFAITGSLPDLQSLTAGLPESVTGSANINGTAEIKDAILHVDAHLSGGPIGFADGTLARFDGNLKASKRMVPLDQQKVYHDGLRTEAHFQFGEIHFKEFVIDSIQADAQSDGSAFKIQRAVVARKGNNLTATGDYQLPDEPAAFRMQPAKLVFSLDAPNVADYWDDAAPTKINGPVQASGEVLLRQGKAQGEMSIFGSNLTSRDLTIPTLSAQASIWNNVVYLNDITANLNEKDFIGGTGNISLEDSLRYDGKLHVNVAELARLKPLLVAIGNNSEIGGALLIDWEGNGEAAKFQNAGDLKLKLERGRYANLLALQANIEANYTREGLDVPIIFVASDKMKLQAVLTAKGSTLEISNIQVDQGQAKYASGYLSLPFVWKNIGTKEPLVPSEGKVAATFQSENLDLKRLFEDLGMPPRATGLLNVKCEANGTMSQLRGRLDVHMSGLRSADYQKLDPASLDLGADLQNNQLAINGKIQQAKIQPVLITANIPFDLSKIISERKLDEAMPLAARVQLPRSPVNFLRQFIPVITQLDGDVTLDARVNGTLAKPILSGSGDITINVARLSNPALPSLGGFRSRMRFDGDVLNFEQFKGDLAGGPFTISGRVTFPKLTQPNLDFQLKAQSILVARNDSLTARADADLKVTGLWSSATVTGTVALTNSQFLKNIDLIPIGLPGRPAPQPPSERPNFSITDPPLRDWKFDIKVKTKDPFLIRGNLANGGAVVDLTLSGTGLRPALQGFVRLQDVEATLPFSRMEIAQGFLYFNPSDSFNPKIDIQGTSRIRDYTVHVYVFGTSLSPEAIFSSEPPLPQEEIISLLATGVTRGELSGNNNVLAGRAAMLLIQQLYRNVFKKSQSKQSGTGVDRLQVDVGNVDPRTGQQTATARYKVNDQFVVIGDLAVGGDFRGMVRYLIRFK